MDWKKGYRKILLWIGIAGVALILFMDFLLLKVFNYDAGVFFFSDKLQTAILFATGAVIYWYTKETFDLKQVQQKQLKEIRKQTDYEIRPFLRLQYNKDSNSIFTIANDGRGLAKDVVFEENSMGPVGHVLKFTIASRPVISAGGHTNVSVGELKERCSGVICIGGDIGRHIGRYIGNGFLVKAVYADVVGRRYEVIFQSDLSYNDGFKVIRQDRVDK